MIEFNNYSLLWRHQCFLEIFVGLVLFIAFIGVLVDQAPKKKEKKNQSEA